MPSTISFAAIVDAAIKKYRISDDATEELGEVSDLQLEAAAGDAGELDAEEGNAGDSINSLQVCIERDANEECRKGYLAQLFLAVGAGAITLGVQDLMTAPKTRKVELIVFYVTQVTMIFLGILLSIIFSKSSRATGEELRKVKKLGKLIMLLTIIPIIVTIIIVHL
ncbi:hypothetical protein KFK09_025302 [Dendrobium nobile]|uniref:Uncharacterized protein n=1 Tax=Dendrobium nobile TaxID=94219 RepID=A0A8T3AG64_DENNO|nr:hypothetical protein KFK09_025302 [Dendrobium nobile]